MLALGSLVWGDEPAVAGSGAGGWSFTLNEVDEGAYHQIEFRHTGGYRYAIEVVVPVNNPKIAVSPENSKVALYDSEARKILIFGFDELLPHFLEKRKPTDFLQEIWWERGERRESLCPVSMKWEDEDMLLIQAEKKPDMEEDTLLTYDVSNWLILGVDDWVEEAVFENGYGRVQHIRRDTEFVMERFMEAGLLKP